MRILATAASEVGKSLTQPNGQSRPSIGSYSMDLVASFGVTEPFLQQKPANVHLLTAGLYAAARKALPYFHLCPLNPKHVTFPVIEETKNFPASEEKLRKYFSWPSQVRDSSNGKRKFLDVSLRVISPIKIGTLKHHSAGLSDLLRKRGKTIFLDQKQASGHVLVLYGVILGAHPNHIIIPSLMAPNVKVINPNPSTGGMKHCAQGSHIKKEDIPQYTGNPVLSPFGFRILSGRFGPLVWTRDVLTCLLLSLYDINNLV